MDYLRNNNNTWQGLSFALDDPKHCTVVYAPSSEVINPVKIIDSDTCKSELPAHTVTATAKATATANAVQFIELKAHSMSETDKNNQRLLANAFVASNQGNPMFAGKKVKVITEYGIYPNRDLTTAENGSKQVLTWKNLPYKVPGVIFAQCYNQTDKAYTITGTIDASGTATFPDYILRAATNIILFVLE